MFAGGGGGVGAVGPLPPLHAIKEPIAIAIASRFILPPNLTDLPLWPVLDQLEGRAGRILRGPYLAPSMMLLMPITKLNRPSGLLLLKLQRRTTLDRSAGNMMLNEL